jgi:hypothetical protein
MRRSFGRTRGGSALLVAMLGWVAWWLPGVARAMAPTATCQYSLAELAKKELKVKVTGGSLDIGETKGDCNVDVQKLADGEWSIKPPTAGAGDGDGCAQLWRNEPLESKSLKLPGRVGAKSEPIDVTCSLSPSLDGAAKPGYEPKLKEDGKNVSGLPEAMEVFAYATDVGWYGSKVENGVVELRGKTTEGASIRVVYLDVDALGSPRGYVAAEVSRTKTDDAGEKGRGTVPMTCEGPRSRNTAYVCAIVDGNTISFEQTPPSVIAPNTSIEVEVIHSSKLDVDIELTGKRGVFIPGDRFTGTPENKAQAGGDEKKPPPPIRVRQVFAPREPGDADLKIKILGENNAVTAERTLEFIIDRTYAGAVRLGVAVVFANAVDREYAARTVGNSQQAEIVATKAGRTGFEVVLGYAPYAFDYIQNRGRGRSYANTSLRDRAGGFAPYAGLGLLAASGTGVEILKSVHMGLEWEPTPNFSIGLTAVARRVTRLGDGLSVGSPVTGDVPTQEVIRWGGALVLNFSTEFFRTAGRESRPTLGRSGN